MTNVTPSQYDDLFHRWEDFKPPVVGQTLMDRVRDRLIEEQLAYHDHPTNPLQAARSGWEACLKYLATQAIASTPSL